MIGEVERQIISDSFKATFNAMDVIPHAVGFMPDHVHIAVSIPPKVALADVVRRLKGASSRAINANTVRIEAPRFAWQDEYGSLSFGEKALSKVVAYIETQVEIHAKRDTWPSMERTSEGIQPG